MTRAQQKWGLGINRNKAYKARSIAIDVLNGSVREQYTKIDDYTHELLRSNEGPTVRVTTIPF